MHFPDIPLKQLRYSALIQERGGVGYYPTSALPFVHIDTDRVRSWPRLPRHELALLFPSGATRHMPAEGGAITREDVRVAKVRHQDLAQQIAMFLSHRGTGGPPIAIAAADGPAMKPSTPQRVAAIPGNIRPAPPSLVEQPQLAARPQWMPAPIRAAFTPSAGDRARFAELVNLAASLPTLVSGPAPARRPEARVPSLTGTSLPPPPLGSPKGRPAASAQLASLGPSVLPELPETDNGGWITAPAYDEEHPEELSYRPFPIAPYLTESAAEALLSDFVAHDVARTLDLLDQPEVTASLNFRPSTHATAALLTTQRFTGAAIRLDGMRETSAIPTGPTPGDRPIASSTQR